MTVSCVRGGWTPPSREELDAFLSDVALRDARCTALTGFDADDVRRQVEELTHDTRRREGALAGQTVVIKDNIDVAGEVTACGSRSHDGIPAPEDAPVVARLREAGAILLGRGRMDELAMGASTQTCADGRARNPHDPRRSPGGSSGGCAAAVAAGMTRFAVGTDTGGSIREPASQCGIVGMAPSPGLVPVEGVVPFAPDCDRVGPLAATVGDAALLLSVLAGRPDLAHIDPTPRELRLGVIEEVSGPPNQPGVLARHSVALQALLERGGHVSTVSMPDARAALGAYMTLTSVAALPMLRPRVETGRVGEEVARRYDYARRLSADTGALSGAAAVRERLRTECAAALGEVDLLLCPTMPTTAPLLDGDISPEELADPLAAPYTDCWTVIANLAGLPAISVPAGCSDADGMPVGAMLMGRPGDDALLLAAAAMLERAV